MISAVDYLKSKGRMTDNCNINCNECTLHSKREGCAKFETNHPDEAVKIVEDWMKEYPVKTNLQVFKEEIEPLIKSKYGNEVLYCSIADKIPMLYCDNFNNCEDCEKFWAKECKESEEI